MSPLTVVSLRPRFKIESIIPGIDALAPLLMETSNGLSASPNLAFIVFSTFFKAFKTSFFNFLGYVFLLE